MKSQRLQLFYKKFKKLLFQDLDFVGKTIEQRFGYSHRKLFNFTSKIIKWNLSLL
jgi:hypothetical protein